METNRQSEMREKKKTESNMKHSVPCRRVSGGKSQLVFSDLFMKMGFKGPEIPLEARCLRCVEYTTYINSSLRYN